MSDNPLFTASIATYRVAADEVSYSGNADALAQLLRVVKTTGAEGSKTVGSLNYHRISTADNNAQSVSAFATDVQSLECGNLAAYAIQVKLYNKASAPNPASDTAVRTFVFQAEMPRYIPFNGGLAGLFPLGLAIAIVKASAPLAEIDNVAVAAGDCVIDLEYTRAS